MDQQADRAAEDDAEQAAGGGEEDRFDQELPEDLAAAGAERLADADLAGAFGDRDHHDRHHADAADHQGDRGDHDERQEGGLADLLPYFQHRVLGGETEVVRFVELEAVASPHEAFDILHRHVAHADARYDRDHPGPEDRGIEVAGRDLGGSPQHLSINLLVSAIGDDGEIVDLGGEAPRARSLAEYPDHGELLIAHADLLADRIDVGKQRQPRTVAEQHDVLA